MTKKLKSELGWSTADRIVVRGRDLVQDLIGEVSLGDVAFLELKGRLPTRQESIVFNAIVVTLVEHGMTPSAIAARLTYFGAPESLQGAVAAGLLGMGDRFGGSAEDAARMLQAALEGADPDVDLKAMASSIVSDHKASKQPVAGLGHPIHKPVDPRTAKLFEVAAANGLSGRYVELMQLVGEEATRVLARELPVNATGAIGAIASELGISWRVCRGLAVMARAIGLVAHIQEEIEEPLAAEIWSRIEGESSSHNRPGTD
ncbi:MAG TPA: citryl-CoA lyase [Candidatus Acidoferrum sp.]|jgi:citrate synthase|nr:citryl-CoA lyase [Candidatus Acidoferrum sp.]